MRELALILVGLVLAFPARAAAGDPFRELDLFRSSRPTQAADFAVPALTAGTLRLSDVSGGVVLVNFWATWCPPCKQEMPSMERLYRRHKDRGFTVLAISLDTGGEGPVAAFVKRLGLTFPVGLDPKMAVAQLYGVRGLPASFFVGRTGQIAGIALGSRDFDSAPAHAVVEALLR